MDRIRKGLNVTLKRTKIMEINTKSTKAAYPQVYFEPYENGIIEVTYMHHDSFIWMAINHLLGANQHLIPMSMTTERIYGGTKVVLLFVEQSVFGQH